MVYVRCWQQTTTLCGDIGGPSRRCCGTIHKLVLDGMIKVWQQGEVVVEERVRKPRCGRQRSRWLGLQGEGEEEGE